MFFSRLKIEVLRVYNPQTFILMGVAWLEKSRHLYWRDNLKECGRFCLEPKLYIECCVFVSSPTTTDDEMFADSFKIAESEDGIFYEVEGKVSRKMGTDNFLA